MYIGPCQSPLGQSLTEFGGTGHQVLSFGIEGGVRTPTRRYYIVKHLPLREEICHEDALRALRNCTATSR